MFGKKKLDMFIKLLKTRVEGLSAVVRNHEYRIDALERVVADLVSREFGVKIIWMDSSQFGAVNTDSSKANDVVEYLRKMGFDAVLITENQFKVMLNET